MAKTDYIDLRSPSQLVNFNKMLKAAMKKGVFILVHADYCGPCQEYKKTVWNDLVSKRGRKAGMAGIHYDQLENSPFAGVNIKGYPSVIYVTQNGTVKKVSNFNDSETGTQTNAMPSDTMRNKELMEKLVNSGPNEVQNAVPSMEKLPESEVQNESSDEGVSSSDEEPEFAPEATALRNNVTAENTIQTINKPEKSVLKKGTPPKTNDDVILDSVAENKVEASPVLNFSPNAPNNSAPEKGKGSAVGGALYSALKSSTRRKRKTNKRRSRMNQKKGKQTRGK
jgi:thiol-disulfide isomerase/thioredoxin